MKINIWATVALAAFVSGCEENPVDTDLDSDVDVGTDVVEEMVNLTLSLALGEFIEGADDNIVEPCTFSIPGYGNVASGSTIQVPAGTCVEVAIAGGSHYSAALDLNVDIREPQKEVCVDSEDVAITLEADPVYRNAWMMCDVSYRLSDNEEWEHLHSFQTDPSTAGWNDEYMATCYHLNNNEGDLCIYDLDWVVQYASQGETRTAEGEDAVTLLNRWIGYESLNPYPTLVTCDVNESR